MELVKLILGAMVGIGVLLLILGGGAAIAVVMAAVGGVVFVCVLGVGILGFAKECWDGYWKRRRKIRMNLKK